VTWVMWSLILFHLDTVLVSLQDWSRFAPNVNEAQKSFWTHPMVFLGDKAQVEARFGLFGGCANIDAR
jgi:extradiol dioxygenase family protein